MRNIFKVENGQTSGEGTLEIETDNEKLSFILNGNTCSIAKMVLRQLGE
jgi:hypothetical protein